MNNISRIGIDLAKNVFQVCALDKRNKILFNKKLGRQTFTRFMAQLPACPVYLEACYSSHYWGRALKEMGHIPHLIPAQHVKPFVRGNKNDNNDALAVAEATQRPNIRFVPIKTVEQQEIMAMHRLRSRLIRNRTSLSNQVRGLLSDFGIIFPRGFKAFREKMQGLQDNSRLSSTFRQLMLDMYSEFNRISEQIETIERHLKSHLAKNDHCAIVSSIPGIGPINASALVASIKM